MKIVVNVMEISRQFERAGKNRRAFVVSTSEKFAT